MTQEKVSKEETADLVKIIQAINPGNLLKALEIGLQSLIDAETSIILGATPYERTSNRKTYRNGTRVKGVNSAMGKLTALIPKFREGSYFPSVLEKFKRTDRALISVISQAYINGVSTRKMDDLFVEMGLDKIDKSFVSRCSQAIEQEVLEWKSRPLERVYPYIWLDAIYTKIREGGKILPVAVLLCIAVREDGYRDVLGFSIGSSETSSNWKALLNDLKSRGLERSELWISDDHDGLAKAVTECFPGQQRQRCIIHWMRNAIDQSYKTDHQWLLPLLRSVVNSEDNLTFQMSWNNLIRACKERHKDKLTYWFENTYSEISAFLNFPPEHRRKIKSTNPIERLNEEIRRRERAVRIFPDVRSCIKLIGAVLQDYSDNWICNRIYLQKPMESIREYVLDKMKLDQEKVIMKSNITA